MSTKALLISAVALLLGACQAPTVTRITQLTPGIGYRADLGVQRTAWGPLRTFEGVRFTPKPSRWAVRPIRSGEVVLDILVDETGSVRDIGIAATSGDPNFDSAMAESFRNARYPILDENNTTSRYVSRQLVHVNVIPNDRTISRQNYENYSDDKSYHPQMFVPNVTSPPTTQ